MYFFLEGKPKAKPRPRFNTRTGRAYTPNKSEEQQAKFEIGKQMREKGFSKPAKQPLQLELTSFIQLPQSWSTAKKKRFYGQPCTTKPDLDNTIKFYCDVLNNLAYEDDAQITRLISEKIYSDKPGIEMLITPIENKMIHEHAKTIQGEMTMSDLEYIVKKAHRLGLSGRQLLRVYSQEDGDGKHIYLECEGLKPRLPAGKGLC